MVQRIIPFILSFIVLAAHFLRFGNLLLTALCLLIPFLLLVKKRWILIALQALTVAGALFWVKVAIDLLFFRLAVGVPWMRMVAILGAVAVFTLWSAWLLTSPKVAKRFQLTDNYQ